MPSPRQARIDAVGADHIIIICGIEQTAFFVGKSVSEARRNLQRQIVRWAVKGRRHELTGGGLVRSAGGWRTVKDA